MSYDSGYNAGLLAGKEASEAQIKSLKAELGIARDALEKIGEPDDTNTNFEKSEDEANYYIQTADKALAQIDKTP